ncbi:hypothetical protein I3760_01G105700 [Carya illinoinensis]|nr:hypothetical protein I3760_01G105700 [Carya illinoinensis]
MQGICRSVVCKVHEQLRKVTKEAYEPVLLAIGPYNYNQGEPVGGAFMKEHKECYLQQMLDRTTGSKERYMKALEKLEVKARTCYVECTSQISPQEFAKMMLLDGCFIIELFHKYETYCNIGDCPDDPIFKMEWVLPRIACDLLLFENQLPFFVLLELFRMTESRNSREHTEDVNIHGATELKEARIEFKKSENNNMLSIKFNNAQMEVSPLLIDDRTETCLRNLIAYEQYCDRDESLNYVTNYVFFMDSLINSTKDVELLRQKGIIQNYLGDDKATSTMVNKLCDNINFSTYNIYSRTSRNLNEHCRGCCNNQMAKLKRDYFNSPWAWISFLAATLLLVLTFVQTVFSIIP